MIMQHKVFCPAKINLFLEVLDKRSDGYHNIDSIMQSVSLCDTITVSVRQSTDGSDNAELTVEPYDDRIPLDDKNTAVRAVKLFTERFGKHGYTVSVRIEKRIPIEAGLAGGSTDGAGVLLALGVIFGVNDREELLKLGAQIGADVPFCMTCGAARTTGIGDIMEKLPSLSPEYTVVIAKGKNTSVSTREAYAKIDALGVRAYKNGDAAAKALKSGELHGLFADMYNIFGLLDGEAYADADRAKRIIAGCGAQGTVMSGSGPSVVGIFSDYDSAEAACDRLSANGFEAFICVPVV